MAATTSGALKAAIEQLGLSVSVYRDRAPEGTAQPYVTVIEAIAIVPDKLEDGAASTGRETAQVDLWQTWKDPNTGKPAESATLSASLVRGLQGLALAASPTHTYATLIRRVGPRLVEEEENITHLPITLEVWRVI